MMNQEKRLFGQLVSCVCVCQQLLICKERETLVGVDSYKVVELHTKNGAAYKTQAALTSQRTN